MSEYEGDTITGGGLAEQKNGGVKMSKLVGFRVPNGSDLPNRLRAIGLRLSLKYGDLLERWIIAEEAGAIPDGKRAATGRAKNTGPKVSRNDKPLDVDTLLYADLSARMSAFEKRLAKIEARPTDAMQEKMSGATAEPEVVPYPPRGRRNRIAEATDKGDFSKRRAPRPAKQKKKQQQKQKKTKTPLPTARPSAPTGKAAILARVNELRSAGLTFRKIADRLAAEKVPTLSGTGAWSSGTISKLLKKPAHSK